MLLLQLLTKPTKIKDYQRVVTTFVHKMVHLVKQTPKRVGIILQSGSPLRKDNILESLDNGTTFLTHENDNYLFIVELLVILCFFWSLPSLLVYQTVRFVKRFSLFKSNIIDRFFITAITGRNNKPSEIFSRIMRGQNKWPYCRTRKCFVDQEDFQSYIYTQQNKDFPCLPTGLLLLVGRGIYPSKSRTELQIHKTTNTPNN